jgi:hypothetical protein
LSDDHLNDFECSEFTYEGEGCKVFRVGTGPAVIVMAEVPGITPNSRQMSLCPHVRNEARRILHFT